MAKLVYEVQEYASIPTTDDAFTHRMVLTFTSPETVLEFLEQRDDFYGICYVYDYAQYAHYHDTADFTMFAQVPKPLHEFTADINTSIEDFVIA